MLQAENHSIEIDGGTLDFIAFGSGEKALVMLPGLGDGIKTVKNAARSFALLYRTFAKAYRVYVFSRRNDLPACFSIRDMACDQARVMMALGIGNAHILGVSQGGMIALQLAAEYPALVDKLVLANTAAGATDAARRVIGGWIALAERDDYPALFLDMAEKTYSQRKLKTYRPLCPLLAAVTKPQSYNRFITQANACLSFDARAQLGCIGAPTLVIGGGEDQIVGKDAARELAAGIEGSTLYIYPSLGHGVYEEAPDFHARVLDFLEG